MELFHHKTRNRVFTIGLAVKDPGHIGIRDHAHAGDIFEKGIVAQHYTEISRLLDISVLKADNQSALEVGNMVLQRERFLSVI